MTHTRILKRSVSNVGLTMLIISALGFAAMLLRAQMLTPTPLVTFTFGQSTVGVSTMDMMFQTSAPALTGINYGILGNTTQRQMALSSQLVRDHSVSLTGLDPATTYSYHVWALPEGDARGILQYSEIRSFRTQAAFTIDEVRESSVTPTSATITFVTSKDTTAAVFYGTDSDYSNSQAGSSTPTRVHSITLTNLTPSTPYHYQITADDGKYRHSTADRMFSAISPVTVSLVTVSDITPTSAKVSWSTDRPTTGEVQYGLSANAYSRTARDSTSGKNHSVLLSLGANQRFYYRVVADEGGYLAPTPESNFYSAYSLSPNATVTPTSAKVSWGIAEDSDGAVQYSLPPLAGDSVVTDTVLGKDHSVTIGKLSPSTRYAYKASSAYTDRRDSLRKTAESSILSFTTQPSDTTAPTITSGPKVDSNIRIGTTVSASIVLDTDEPSRASLQYSFFRQGMWTGSMDATEVLTDDEEKKLFVYDTHHRFSIDGLPPNTTVRYWVTVTDQTGNSQKTPLGSPETFITAR